MLVDRGQLDLNAPVSQYLPFMKQMRVLPAAAKGSHLAKTTMRLWHLLTHTAGFSYQADFNFPPDETQKRYSKIADRLYSGKILTLAAWVRELAKVPLCCEP